MRWMAVPRSRLGSAMADLVGRAGLLLRLRVLRLLLLLLGVARGLM